MKYIISESRVEKAIYEYMDELFGDVMYERYYYFDKESYTDNVLEFYNKDLEDSGDYLFEYVKKEYYDEPHIGQHLKEKYLSQAPMVEFLHSYTTRQLDAYFGDRWKQVFVKWFKDKFNLPVKTIYT
jgi:hypothetical protein